MALPSSAGILPALAASVRALVPGLAYKLSQGSDCSNSEWNGKGAREEGFLEGTSGVKTGDALQMNFDVILESHCKLTRNFPRRGKLPIGLDASHAGNFARGGADEDFLRRIKDAGSEVLLQKCESSRGNEFAEDLAGYSRQAAGRQGRRHNLAAAHQEDIGRCAFRQVALFV